MPVQTTYPGVYVEELAGGARSITGVSTSEAAFIDWFERGPVTGPVRVTSFEDFDRRFGGVHTRSEASYALQQYFLNGGSVAWIVRTVAANSAASTLESPIHCDSLPFGTTGSPGDTTLAVSAMSPGAWGNRIQVGIGYPEASGAPTKFDLVVRELAPATAGGKARVVATEIFRNLNMDPQDAKYVVDIVNAQSNLVRVVVAGAGTNLPNATGTQVLADVELADSVPDPENSANALAGRGSEAFRTLGNGNDGALPQSSEWINTFGVGALLGFDVAGTGPTTTLARKNRGIFELDTIEPFIFNLMCIPAAAELNDSGMAAVYAAAIAFCQAKRAFLLIDPKPATEWTKDNYLENVAWGAKIDRVRSNSSALYFPRLLIPDIRDENRPRDVAPSGTIAGVFARSDATRGVWNAPAGTDARLVGADLAAKLTDLDNGFLNTRGINVLRNFPIHGNICWGARTLDGADAAASEWKYISVRRTALYIEESLFQGLKWVVFQGNDEPLWSQIRLNVGAFMHNLFRQGAFQGKTPRDAYFVKCDRDTTTQNDIDLGIVNILVGFAPLKPAEFVIIKVQQIVKPAEV